MLEWLFGKKKPATQALEVKEEDEERDEQREKSKTTAAVGLAATESAQGSIRQAAQTFAKPQQYTGNRNLYDSSAAKRAVKMEAFQSGEPVYDRHTGNEIFQTIKEAKQKCGSTGYAAEVDHVVPLKQIHEQIKSMPWIKAENAKDIANIRENLDLTSHEFNNAKRDLTNTEFVKRQDYRQSKGIELTEEGEIYTIQVDSKARRATKNKMRTLSTQNAVATVHDAGMQGAQYGGITAFTVSGINNVVAVVRGEKTAEEALVDTARDSGQAAVSSYVMSGGLTFVGQQLSTASSPIIKNLAASNVPGTVITAVMATGDVLVRYGRGEITTQECILALGERGINFAASGYGAIVGQALIPIPIVGGAIGSMVGGSVTSFLASNMRESLDERDKRIAQQMMEYYAEEKRREKVKKLIHVNTVEAAQNSLARIANSGVLKNLTSEWKLTVEDEIQTRQIVANYLLATLCLQEYRRELQEYINDYFNGYEQCFSEAINIMDTALEMEDYENATVGANKISRLFGKEPIVEDTQDFIKRTFGDEPIIL